MRKYIILFFSIILFNVFASAQCQIIGYTPNIGPFNMTLDGNGDYVYTFTPGTKGQWRTVNCPTAALGPIFFYSGSGTVTLKYSPSTMQYKTIEPVPNFCARSSTNGFL